MTAETLESRMRAAEAVPGDVLPADSLIVLRLDGRNFTRLTKDILEIDVPFDAGFHEDMVYAAEGLMCNSGVGILHAHIQSDEISLLLDPKDESFGRRRLKLCTILAGEASADLSSSLQETAVFDCRASVHASVDSVVEYFQWRRGDAENNCLNAHCHWSLRRSGLSPAAAHSALLGKGREERIAMLAGLGLPFDELPMWQKFGTGLVWKDFPRVGVDPRDGARVEARRRWVNHLGELADPIAHRAAIRELIEV